MPQPLIDAVTKTLTEARGRVALLAMDYQTSIVALMVKEPAPLLERVAAVLRAARTARLPVLYATFGFRPGYPEVDPANTLIAGMAAQGLFALGAPGTEVHPAVAPQPDDITLVRHRTNAFYGTDLQVILAARGIRTLILMGIATRGVLLSTVRHAFDADYRMIVADDCCADPDPEVHRMVLEKVLARQVQLIGAGDLIAALSAATAAAAASPATAASS